MHPNTDTNTDAVASPNATASVNKNKNKNKNTKNKAPRGAFSVGENAPRDLQRRHRTNKTEQKAKTDAQNKGPLV